MKISLFYIRYIFKEKKIEYIMEKSKSIIKSISFNNNFFLIKKILQSIHISQNTIIFYICDNKINKTINSINDFEIINNSLISYEKFYGSLLKENSFIQKSKTPTIRYYKLNINKKLTRLGQIENNFNLSKNNNNDDSQDYSEEEIEDFKEIFSSINKINDSFIGEESI